MQARRASVHAEKWSLEILYRKTVVLRLDVQQFFLPDTEHHRVSGGIGGMCPPSMFVPSCCAQISGPENHDQYGYNSRL
jgi:hypothetical protein